MITLFVAALLATLAPLGARAAEAPHAAEAEPQLLRGPSAGLVTAVTTLIVFAMLLAVLGKYAWGPIAAGLKAREDRIRKDIADAEAARAKAEATLREYAARMNQAEARVREMINQATTEGERIATTIRIHAQQEAEQIKEKATHDIEASRDQAIREIYRQAADLATGVAEKFLRRNLNAADQRDLVNASLEEFQSLNRG
jgi:F-type H+-transporting ATPase subunit b